jgi:DHA1 family tetracycline resistance protein-like MFS transporter
MIALRRTRDARIGFVLVTLAIDAVGIGIVIPIVPELVRTLTGLDRSDASHYVGALVGCYAAAQFFAGPVLGALSDRLGRRPVILASLAGLGANYVLLAVAPTLTWLFVGRLLAGATGANVSCTMAYIADVTPPAERGKRFGLVGAVFGCAFVLGPAIGGELGGVDLRLPFIAAACLSFCNLLYGLIVLPESLPPERRRALDWRRANPVGSLGVLARDREARRLAVAWCCMWFGMGALQTTFVLYTGLRLGWDQRQCGYALAAIGLSQALVLGVLVRRVIARIGERRTALTGFMFSCAAFLVLASASHGWMIYAGAVLQALGTMANPATRALLSAGAGPERQGERQGGLSSVEGLTAIVSPLVAASLFGYFSQEAAVVHVPGAAFIAAACVFVVAFFAVRGLPKLPIGDLEPPRVATPESAAVDVLGEA